MKTSLIIIALALLACFVLLMLRSRPDEPVAASVSNTSRGPSFEVRVVMPRLGLPLGGILPDWFVKKHNLTPSEMWFDYASRGAKIGSVGPDRLELTAEGWDLLIETDGDGRITPGTRLVFDLGLGGKKVKLRCRPANPAIGNLQTTTRAGSNDLGGNFLVQLATCENTETGDATNWPPAPLTVRGRFAGLPPGRR